MNNALPTLTCPEESFPFQNILHWHKCDFSCPIKHWNLSDVLEIVFICPQSYVQISPCWYLKISHGGGGIIYTKEIRKCYKLDLPALPTTSLFMKSIWHKKFTMRWYSVNFYWMVFHMLKVFLFGFHYTGYMFLFAFWREKYLTIVGKRTW